MTTTIPAEVLESWVEALTAAFAELHSVVRRLHAAGLSTDQIISMVGCDPASVRSILGLPDDGK